MPIPSRPVSNSANFHPSRMAVMANYNIFLLPGDGIGPEVMTEVEKVAAFMGEAGLAKFEFERGLVGGAAYDAHGKAISEEHMALAQAADAVIFGAVGGPKWDSVPYDVRPEAGLLRLRASSKATRPMRSIS